MISFNMYMCVTVYMRVRIYLCVLCVCVCMFVRMYSLIPLVLSSGSDDEAYGLHSSS